MLALDELIGADDISSPEDRICRRPQQLMSASILHRGAPPEFPSAGSLSDTLLECNQNKIIQWRKAADGSAKNFAVERSHVEDSLGSHSRVASVMDLARTVT